jgi:hypothetical protein
MPKEQFLWPRFSRPYALDAPTLLNGAVARGDMLPEYTCAKTAGEAFAGDGMGWLVIYFHPADPMDRPDIDTLEIKLLDPHGEGHWYVDIARRRDPAENGKVIAVLDGLHDDVPVADKRSCRKLVEALHGAVREAA